jgi:aerobic carbon-monoxide dehydrogenase large subunit
MTRSPLIGTRLPRKEDTSFLTGKSQFTDDLSLGQQCYAQFVRSPHPHARILRIDADDARSMAGVVAVLTHADLEAAGVGVIPTLTRAPGFAVLDRHGNPIPDPAQYPLARDKVRFAGEPIAMVVGTSIEAARDGCEAVVVEFDELVPVISHDDCLAASSAAVWDDVPDNRTLDWAMGDAEAARVAFDEAEHTIGVDLVNNRLAICFMEPRAALAEYDEDADRFMLSAGSQTAHGLQAALCGMFGIPTDKLHVVTPATGGGFGARGAPYPEYTSLLVAAKNIGRPVKWTADRSEAFLTDCQARDHRIRGEMAVAKDGTFTGLRVRIEWRHGGYLTPRSMLVMVTYLPPTVGGVYGIRHLELDMLCLLSNTTPQSAYRGVGRVEATYLMESLVERAAVVTGIDAVQLRYKNLVTASQFPWKAAGGAVYNSGEFAANLGKALLCADRDGFESRRHESAARGLLRGFGLAMYIENDGGAPTEFARVVAHGDGRVVLYAGTQDFGMGHSTVFSQVLADKLGVDFDDVQLVEGDTDKVASGFGSHGSRSARIGGGAVVHGALALIESGKPHAGDMLEVAPSDIEFADGAFTVVGTDRSVTLREVALHVETTGLELDGEHVFKTQAPAHSNGAQVCELEIDPETGHITIAAHTIVADVGRILNPLIVEGQMHGGLAQGLGQAWMEEVRYAPDSGQTLTGSFMDYTLPRADNFPNFGAAFNEVDEADNPLGVKGAGEGPTSGAPAAFMNALRDALRDVPGVTANGIHMPATPEKVWRAINRPA